MVQLLRQQAFTSGSNGRIVKIMRSGFERSLQFSPQNRMHTMWTDDMTAVNLCSFLNQPRALVSARDDDIVRSSNDIKYLFFLS